MHEPIESLIQRFQCNHAITMSLGAVVSKRYFETSFQNFAIWFQNFFWKLVCLKEPPKIAKKPFDLARNRPFLRKKENLLLFGGLSHLKIRFLKKIQSSPQSRAWGWSRWPVWRGGFNLIGEHFRCFKNCLFLWSAKGQRQVKKQHHTETPLFAKATKQLFFKQD